MLQCVAVRPVDWENPLTFVDDLCCSVLQCVVVCCSAFHCITVCQSVPGVYGVDVDRICVRLVGISRHTLSGLQCVAVCCSVPGQRLTCDWSESVELPVRSSGPMLRARTMMGDM